MTDYGSEEFWRGAPEGSTHYFAPFFYRADETRAYVFETTWSPSAYTSRQIGEIGVKKPAAAPPWSGDGLPPVGIPVEWSEWLDGKYQVVTVLAYAGGDAWIKPEGKPSMIVGRPAGFRPIKTPVQIAADEREAAIEAMISKIKDHPHKYQSVSHFAQLKIREDACVDLYDAGLRFPKGDDQ